MQPQFFHPSRLHSHMKRYVRSVENQAWTWRNCSSTDGDKEERQTCLLHVDICLLACLEVCVVFFLCRWIPLLCVSIQATHTHGGVRRISLCHVSPYRYWPLVTLMRQIPGLTRFLFFLFILFSLNIFFISHPTKLEPFNMSAYAPSHSLTFTFTLRPSVQCYPTCLLVTLIAVINLMPWNTCPVTYSYTHGLPVLINVNRNIDNPYFLLYSLASFGYFAN